ncbi:MAG: hypothetical protein M3041_01585 [Acidobacteriota bacterium]|nr:hypothetical protein [Acidobacteriota bacterium]
MKKFFLFAIVIAALALPLVLYARVRMAEAAWARSFGPLEQFPDRYHSEKNETADMLSGWIAAVGVHVPGDKIPIDPPPAEVLAAVRKYIEDQFASTSSRPLAPPPSVERYVLGRARLFDSMAADMRHLPPPSWPIEYGPAGYAPNFLPLIQLHKFLLAAALVRDRRGDHAGGEELLLASWKLNQSLRERPEFVAHVVATSIFRMQILAMRHMSVDPNSWRKRLLEHDYRASLVTASQSDTYRTTRAIKTNIYADARFIDEERAISAQMGWTLGARPRWKILLTTPIRWLDLPALMESSRQLLVAGQKRPIDETADLAVAYQRGLSQWFYVPDPDVASSDISGTFKRLDRLLNEAELTEKVLIARAAREANGGRWPKSIPGFETSQITNGHWIYEASAGGILIRFSREVRWPDSLLGNSSPLQYTTISSS